MAKKKAAVWQHHREPRETLLHQGASVLSDIELLAIFLRTGVVGMDVITLSRYLLNEFGSLYELMKADYVTFCTKRGLGSSKFTQLQASIELARRFFSVSIAKEDAVCSPEATRSYLQNLISHRKREIFVVMFLDNQNRVIRHEEMFSGSISSVEVHPREIIREALHANASGIILAHNHPSGSAEPSESDLLLTREIAKACALFGIRMLDHIVLGQGESVSFAERGWI